MEALVRLECYFSSVLVWSTIAELSKLLQKPLQGLDPVRFSGPECRNSPSNCPLGKYPETTAKQFKKVKKAASTYLDERSVNYEIFQNFIAICPKVSKHK